MSKQIKAIIISIVLIIIGLLTAGGIYHRAVIKKWFKETFPTKQTVNNLKKDNAAKDEQLKEQADALENYKSSVSNLTKQLGNANSEMIRLNSSLQETKAKLDQKEEETTVVVAQKTALLNVVTEIDNKLNNTTEVIDIDELEAKKNLIMSQIETLNSKISVLTEEKLLLQSNVETLTYEKNALQAQINSLATAQELVYSNVETLFDAYNLVIDNLSDNRDEAILQKCQAIASYIEDLSNRTFEYTYKEFYGSCSTGNSSFTFNENMTERTALRIRTTDGGYYINFTEFYKSLGNVIDDYGMIYVNSGYVDEYVIKSMNSDTLTLKFVKNKYLLADGAEYFVAAETVDDLSDVNRTFYVNGVLVDSVPDDTACTSYIYVVNRTTRTFETYLFDENFTSNLIQ